MLLLPFFPSVAQILDRATYRYTRLKSSWFPPSRLFLSRSLRSSPRFDLAHFLPWIRGSTGEASAERSSVPHPRSSPSSSGIGFSRRHQLKILK